MIYVQAAEVGTDAEWLKYELIKGALVLLSYTGTCGLTRDNRTTWY